MSLRGTKQSKNFKNLKFHFNLNPQTCHSELNSESKTLQNKSNYFYMEQSFFENGMEVDFSESAFIEGLNLQELSGLILYCSYLPKEAIVSIELPDNHPYITEDNCGYKNVKLPLSDLIHPNDKYTDSGF
jgi:hypothetical protein